MTQSRALQSGRSATRSLFESLSGSKFLIGTGAAVVACAALGAAPLVVRSSASVTNNVANAPAAVSRASYVAPSTVVALPRVADRWYEDATPGRVASTPRVADRWYEETSIGAAAVKPVV